MAMFSGRLFHSLMVKGKKEKRYVLRLSCSDLKCCE